MPLPRSLPDILALLAVTVPGLLEKRPSVVVGDLIKVRINGESVAHGGYVHKVKAKRVGVHMAYDFPKLDGNMSFPQRPPQAHTPRLRLSVNWTSWY